MKLKSWVLFAFFSLFFFQLVDIQAQKIEKKYSIRWESPISYYINDEKKVSCLYFQNAISDENFAEIPKFFDRIPVETAFQDYEVAILDLKFTPLTTEECKLLPDSFSQKKLEVKVRTTTERRQHFATISFIPIVETGNGKFEKLTDFTLSITGKNPLQQPKRERFAAHSVLRSGSWYKVAVSQTGIHKISFDDLVTLGAATASFPSANIALFGNGGGTLPENNSAPRLDDLTENPIQIFDGGDGSFNSGDYFIFYAEGPHKWDYKNQIFNHTYNIYSDYAYYFICLDAGVGEKKRISAVDHNSLISNKLATTTCFYHFIEKDEKTFGETGQSWFGDAFDYTTTRTYEVATPPLTSDNLRISVAAAAVSTSSSYFSINVNGASAGSLSIAAIGEAYGKEARRDFYTTSAAGARQLQIALTYSKPTNSSVGYLDYIELQGFAQLSMTGSQMPFCNTQVIGNQNVTDFHIANANSNIKVWDVTKGTAPFQILGNLSGQTLSIKAKTDSLRRFVAFDGSAFHAVKPIGKVENQDLHGSSDVNMVIVAHPNFVQQAERLADFRRTRQGLTVKIVTPQQIYNEFASGAQDPTAIRDYMRFIYKTSTGNPNYLLLFGRPCYDFRGRVNGTQLFVPNYQQKTALDKNTFRASDDYFGLLDDDEGADCIGTIDVAIGRLPVKTTSEAQTVVDKILTYSADYNIVTDPHALQISNFADWRNIITLVADDEDNYHIYTTESAADFVEQANKNINLDKIYLDAYHQVSNAGEQRYPDVNTAIIERMKKGALLFAYVGHSGIRGWAHERILELNDINDWDNRYNQPLLMTMGCEFGWYDRPTMSPAELAFLNAKGGATALITTSRVAFSLSNKSYSDQLFNGLFQKIGGRYKTVGEHNMYAKNAAGGAANMLNMIYTIGDPAMPLAIPQWNVVTDSINGFAASVLDTIKALSKVTFKGHIVDENGQTHSDFNGNIFPSIFDKKLTVSTLQNDEESPYVEYDIQKNILFKGNATVQNGYFKFSFIVPQDINFSYGNGKVSYYARSENRDAAGNFDQFIIGGKDSTAVNDEEGPEIDAFLNDETFVNGSITDPNPILLINLRDAYGINTTGNGIGHDLVAILDNKTDKQIILNDYYVAVQDSFNCGTVRYPFTNLAVGSHTLKIRAWDIFNNPSELQLDFQVASNEQLSLAHVLNYPNPFTTKTAFFFEQNQPRGTDLDILIQIFTISGKLVKTIEETQIFNTTRCAPIEWDGRDDFGDKLAKGTYIYRLRVRTPSGEIQEKIEKLVIL